jgi:hypothetical protein
MVWVVGGRKSFHGAHHEIAGNRIVGNSWVTDINNWKFIIVNIYVNIEVLKISLKTYWPEPEISTPIWPVARKVALRPRRCISRSIANIENIFPTQMSVPMARQRLPGRRLGR